MLFLHVAKREFFVLALRTITKIIKEIRMQTVKVVFNKQESLPKFKIKNSSKKFSYVVGISGKRISLVFALQFGHSFLFAE